jgi:hypothetical protein
MLCTAAGIGRLSYVRGDSGLRIQNRFVFDLGQTDGKNPPSAPSVQGMTWEADVPRRKRGAKQMTRSWGYERRKANK